MSIPESLLGAFSVLSHDTERETKQGTPFVRPRLGRRIAQEGRRRASTKLQRAYPGRQVRQNADAEADAG